MAKTYLEIAYDIIDQVKGQINSDDSRLEEGWVIGQMNDVRAVLIKQEIDQKKALGDYFYQQTCCLEVKCKELECDGIKSGEKQWYVELPELIGGIEWNDIKYLGLNDFKSSFERTSLVGFNNYEGNIYVGGKPAYNVIGNYDGDGMIAVLKNLPSAGIKYLCLIGVLSEPSSQCDDSLDNIYPLPDHLI